MAINLAIRWSHNNAIAAFVRYARVDNTNTPVYTVAPINPVVTPDVTVFDIATNLPNGQYVVEYKPIYADNRVCPTKTDYTPACPGLLSINAYVNLGNVVVSWSADPEIPKARITVNFPNGGQSVANYSNVTNVNTTTIPIPPGNIGQITVIGQSVCDESTGFYSQFSNTVSVTNGGGTNPIPGAFVVGNNINTLCNGSATTLYTDGVFAIGKILYSDSSLNTPISGYSYVAVTGGEIIYTVHTTTGEVLANSGDRCGVNIVNQIPSDNYQINSVSNIPGFTLTSPVITSSQYVGKRTQSAFSAAIQIDVTSTNVINTKALLLKNMAIVDCKDMSGNATYTFATQSFLPTDSISIYIQPGTCT